MGQALPIIGNILSAAGGVVSQIGQPQADPTAVLIAEKQADADAKNKQAELDAKKEEKMYLYLLIAALAVLVPIIVLGMYFAFK